MPRQQFYTAPPFTVDRDTREDASGRRTRREAMAKTQRSKGRARNAAKTSWILDQLDVPRTTQHKPREPSVVLLCRCPCCREYMLEGSYEAKRCVTCGTAHPMHA